MPDDPIVTPTPEPEKQAASPAQPTPVGLTKDEVSQIVSAALAPIQQSLRGIQQPAPAAEEPVDESEEAFANDFYKAPRATLQRELARLAQPLVAQQADLSSQLYVDQQREQIESKYGPGTWKDIFADKLDPVFDHLRANDPAQLLNKRAIENAIKTVMGDNLDALVDRRAAHTKAQSTAKETERTELRNQLFAESGNLTGGFRRTDKPSLSEEHKDILRKMAEHDGVKRDENLIMAAMASGDTINDYVAMKKSLNGNGKGAQQ